MNLFAAIFMLSVMVTPPPPAPTVAVENSRHPPINLNDIYTYKLSDMDKLFPESDTPKKSATQLPFDYMQSKRK